MASKAKEYQGTAQALRDRLKPFEELLGPLSKPMREKAVAIIKAVGEKLQTEQRQQVEEAKARKLAERQARGHGKGRGGIER